MYGELPRSLFEAATHERVSAVQAGANIFSLCTDCRSLCVSMCGMNRWSKSYANLNRNIDVSVQSVSSLGSAFQGILNRRLRDDRVGREEARGFMS